MATDEVKVDLLDTTAVKHALDEAVVRVFEKKRTASNGWLYKKLTAMAVAALVALFTQFVPKFPEQRFALGAGVLVYFFVSCYVQYLVSYEENDLVFVSKDNFRVHTQLPRFSTEYTVKCVDGKGRGSEQVFQVTSFFDTDGVLLRPQVVAAVGRLDKAKTGGNKHE